MYKVAVSASKSLFNLKSYKLSYIIYVTGFELMYGDLGNMIYFSFFMIQFFTLSLKTMIPKQNIKKEKEFFAEQRNKIYFAATIRNNFSTNVSCFMRTLDPAYALKLVEKYIAQVYLHYISYCDLLLIQLVIFLINWCHISFKLDSPSNFSVAETNKNLQIFYQPH